MPAAQRTYDYYRQAVTGQRLPLAFVDLDLLFQNCASLIEKANGMPIRLATKSIRSTGLLRTVLEHYAGFRGLMAYSAREAAFLSLQGFDDILIAYPTLERSDIKAAVERIKTGANITFMIDCIEQADILAQVATDQQTSLRVCIDVDMSVPLPGLFFGVKRSPVHDARDVSRLCDKLGRHPHLNVCGIMGYEAQMAGVPDRHPHKRLQNLVVGMLKRYTYAGVKKRRAAAVDHLRARGIDVSLVNGGGTGSLAQSRQDESLTELTAGSGLYAPGLFDYYFDLNLVPAAGFALPVTRRPDAGTVTCHGGGYVASGAAGKDRLPIPYLPAGLRLLTTEGAGEVQTPLQGSTQDLRLGDPVFFRHAKAGELCEHFPELFCIQDGKILNRVTTYRGDGVSFL